MNSCFYEGTVVHRRHTPIERSFTYRLFMTYVDLAELDALFGRHGFWSTRFPALARFRRGDYLGDPREPLDVSVRSLVAERTGVPPTGPIRLLTNFRSLGFGMNPVSFYFCYDAAGTRVETLVAEVTNTPWGERYCYVVPYSPSDDVSAAKPSSPKKLHVSPFLDMAMTYRWRLSEPNDRLSIGIENHTADGKPFEAVLALRRVPISRAGRLRMLVRYPLQTWRIALGIYLHALRIWWRGVPFVPHPATQSDESNTVCESAGGRRGGSGNNPATQPASAAQDASQEVNV